MYNTSLAGKEWCRDLPDPRDYHPNDQRTSALVNSRQLNVELSASVNLQEFFNENRQDREDLPSTASACVDVVEYYERRAYGRIEPLSSLFLHQCSTRLQGTAVTNGVGFRDVFKALARFGIPPERSWPSKATAIEKMPDSIVFGAADRFDGLAYVKLDHSNSTGESTLHWVKAFLSLQMPVLFGAAVPSSITTDPDIQYRPTFDSFRCGHGFVALGYDDQRRHASKGALLVRSQWGGWGDNGHGWLPYGFVTDQLAVDFWVISRPSWLARTWN